MKSEQQRFNQKKIQICKVQEIVNETPTIKTFFFDTTIYALPGQFVMVWLPGVDEIPMSLSYVGKRPAITVAKVGQATAEMHELSKGSRLGIRGPYGHGFNLDDYQDVLAVAGGCGSAPIGPALELAMVNSQRLTYLVGARNKSELLFKSRAQNLGIPVEICTDDGSEGYHGFVSNRMVELLKTKRYDLIITCGPEAMLKKVVDIALENKIPIQASMERYMKCGLGICDSCALDGYHVCRDGPVFSGELLAKFNEFGKSHRDPCGRVVHL